MYLWKAVFFMLMIVTTLLERICSGLSPISAKKDRSIARENWVSQKPYNLSLFHGRRPLTGAARERVVRA